MVSWGSGFVELFHTMREEGKKGEMGKKGGKRKKGRTKEVKKEEGESGEEKEGEKQKRRWKKERREDTEFPSTLPVPRSDHLNTSLEPVGPVFPFSQGVAP